MTTLDIPQPYFVLITSLVIVMMIKIHLKKMTSHCHFYISNVQASASSPFQIKIESNVIFSSTEPITEKKTISHDIPIPKFASVHNVYINVLSPMDGMDELDRYNLTAKGAHFIIDPTRKSCPVRQCVDEEVSLMMDLWLSVGCYHNWTFNYDCVLNREILQVVLLQVQLKSQPLLLQHLLFLV